MPALHKQCCWNPALDICLPVWGGFLINYSLPFTLHAHQFFYLLVFMLEKFASLCNINQPPNSAALNIQQQGKGEQNYVFWPVATPVTHIC